MRSLAGVLLVACLAESYSISVHYIPQVNGKLGGVNWGLYGGTK